MLYACNNVRFQCYQKGGNHIVLSAPSAIMVCMPMCVCRCTCACVCVFVCMHAGVCFTLSSFFCFSAKNSEAGSRKQYCNSYLALNTEKKWVEVPQRVGPHCLVLKTPSAIRVSTLGSYVPIMSCWHSIQNSQILILKMGI